jgi:hypothetical protein
MFFGLGCISRLAMIAIVIFAFGSIAMAGLILASDGFSGESIVDLPTVGEQFRLSGDTREVPSEADVDNTADGKINDVVEKREIFAEVPFWDEVSTEPEVIGTNVGLAIFFALVFGVLGTMLNNLLREHEQEMEDWLEYFYIKRIFRLFGATARQSVERGCLGLPVILAIFAAYGIIFSFLEPGINLLKPEGLQLAIIMSMSVGLISLSGDVAQRQLARFWHQPSRFGVYPANLSIAFVTTVLSRLVNLSPGIMFGTPGGADVEMEEDMRFREVILAVTTLIVVLGFGLAGWSLTALIRDQGDTTLSGDRLEFVAPLAQLAIALGLALFVIAIETAFFEMVPLSLTMGSRLFRWNPILWAAIFMPIFFVFSHTLLNPQGEYLEPFTETPTLLLTGASIILATILVWFWALFRFFDPPHVEAQRRRAAYQAQQASQQPYGQQHGYPQQPPRPTYPPQRPPGQQQYPPPQAPPRRDVYPPPDDDAPRHPH